MMAMTESEIRTMASRRANWLLCLLKDVRAKHVDLRPSKMPPKHYSALFGVAESYQRQLNLTRQLSRYDAPPLARVDSGGTSIAPAPSATRFGAPSAETLMLANRTLPRPYPLWLPAANAAPPLLHHSGSSNIPLGGYHESFFYGGGPHGMRMVTVDELPPYPSQDTPKPTLHVTSRLGPTILAHYLATGRDLEHHVRTNMLSLKASSKNFSMHTYAEALNLARCLHLTILESGSARSALRASVVPEVMLRRLYALLECERLVSVDGMARAQAWSVAGQLLEHTSTAW